MKNAKYEWIEQFSFRACVVQIKEKISTDTRTSLKDGYSIKRERLRKAPEPSDQLYFSTILPHALNRYIRIYTGVHRMCMVQNVNLYVGDVIQATNCISATLLRHPLKRYICI